MPSWDTLVAAEPRLAELEVKARSIAEGAADDRRWCASEAWYRFLAPEVVTMAGRDRSDPHSDAATEKMLRSAAGYRVVCQHLRKLLSDCRHEGDCLW